MIDITSEMNHTVNYAGYILKPLNYVVAYLKPALLQIIKKIELQISEYVIPIYMYKI